MVAVLGWIADGVRPPGDEVRDLARRLRLTRVNASSTVARSLTEPSARRIDSHRAQGALAASLRLTRVTHVLGLDARDVDHPEPVPGLEPLAGSLDVLLARVGSAIAVGGRLREDSLPDLRAGYDQLARDAPRSRPAG